MTLAWTGSARAPWAPWLVIGVLLLFSGGVVVMAQDSDVPTWATVVFGSVGLAAVVSIIFLSRVKVTVDSVRVEVRYGPWGWPVQEFMMSDLTGIEAVWISPRNYGGWGYRWVPRKRLSGAILRKGSGLVLHRADGRLFAVTVDDADSALSRVPGRLARP